MLFINSLIVLFVPLVLGTCLLALLLQAKAGYFRFWEKLALAFAVGISAIVILMSILALLRIPLTLGSLLGLIALLCALAGVYLTRQKTFLFSTSELREACQLKSLNLSSVELSLFILIGLKVFYVYFTALIKPLTDIDAFQFYSIVAKGIFYNHTFLTNYLHGFTIDKPLFAYLSQGWVLLGLQTVNDSILKIISPTLFLGFLLIFYYCLKRYWSRFYSLLFTFLLSTFPFMVYHATTAYADFPMTFYYAVATIYLFLFMKEFDQNNQEAAWANLWLGCTILGLSVWVKRAGLILGGIDLLIIASFVYFHRPTIKLRQLLAPLTLFCFTAGSWLVYGNFAAFFNISSGVFGLETTALPSTFPRPDILTIIAIFSRKVFLYSDWHLLGLLLVMTLLFFYQRAIAKTNRYLLITILLSLLVIVGQFNSRSMYNWLLDGTLLDRLLMNIAPVILFFCAEVILATTKHAPQR